MKRKDVRRPLACLCLMAFLTGLPVLAGASSGEGIYGRELDTLYDMIQGGRDPDAYGEDREDLVAVWEGIRELSPAQGLEQVKYQLLDCNGDGEPELLTGQDNRITNLFTLREGRPHRVFSGWYRDAWYYLGNGRFLNQGAGGAGLSILGEYHLDGDGRKLYLHQLGPGCGKSRSVLEHPWHPRQGPVGETAHDTGAVPGTAGKSDGQGGKTVLAVSGPPGQRECGAVPDPGQ